MPRPSRPRERRASILEAACRVVARKGFRDLRIADVAKEAGLSSGSIHYYFDSKSALVREAFHYQYQASQERRSLGLQGHTNPVDALRAVAEVYLPSTAETVDAWRVWLELWVSAIRDESLRPINDEFYGDWRNSVLALVESAVEQKLISVPDPQVFADAYIGMLDGLAIQVLAGSESMNLERMRQTVQATLDSVSVKAKRR